MKKHRILPQLTRIIRTLLVGSLRTSLYFICVFITLPIFWAVNYDKLHVQIKRNGILFLVYLSIVLSVILHLIYGVGLLDSIYDFIPITLIMIRVLERPHYFFA